MLRNIVGPPARADDFYDREELVELLWERLEAGNVLLAAPRRFGKTSLMYRLLDRPRPGWKPVHIDAESIREPVNFIIALLDALISDRHLRKFLASAWEGTSSWVRGLLAETEIKGPWDVGVKIKLKERIGTHWQERGESLLKALRGYDGGKRLLIVIDELPVMLYLFADNGLSEADARSFLYWFRKMRTDPEIGLRSCRFLVGGSIGIEEYLSQLNAADSFNDFERVPLPELPRAKAEDLVRRLASTRQMKLSPASRRKILELIGAPIPYFIQIFVSEIANAKVMGLSKIGPKRLETIYQDRLLGAASKTYFQHYYDRLRRYDKPAEQAAKQILKTLALAPPGGVGRGELRTLVRRTSGGSVGDERFALLMGDLENDFYIRFDTEREGYSFASKILCDWWRRYYAF